MKFPEQAIYSGFRNSKLIFEINSLSLFKTFSLQCLSSPYLPLTTETSSSFPAAIGHLFNHAKPPRHHLSSQPLEGTSIFGNNRMELLFSVLRFKHFQPSLVSLIHMQGHLQFLPPLQLLFTPVNQLSSSEIHQPTP